jgi:HEAT repeat protein
MAGLASTFELLANVENESAAAVLVAALDSSLLKVRDEAITALLQRRSAPAELNVLRRWPELSERWKTQIAERPGWLSGAIRTAIVNRDAKLIDSACAAAIFTRDYDSIPIFVTAASDRSNLHAGKAAAATLELTELLAEELAAPRDYRVRRDPQLQRTYVLGSLEKGATSLNSHGRLELLEAFLLLAGRENAALKKLLQTPTDRGFASLIDILTSSTRPGIERLLLSFLDDPHAPLSTMQVIGSRSDVPFIRHLTKRIAAEPSHVVRGNLKRIETIGWMATSAAVLDKLREPEQPGAVQLAVLSSVPRDQALAVLAYIARHGKVVARRLAAESLAPFDGRAANELAWSLTEDDDSLVRAAAARQLRERNVPGAIQRLLLMLDSPHVHEREAAKAGLTEFTLDRFAANFDEMTPDQRRSAGTMVRRVDAEAAERIRKDLDSLHKAARRRAIEFAVALDIVGQLEEPIAALLKDEDQYLRIDAIRALATKDSPLVRQAIRDALLDSQPLVQQAAEAALQELTRGDTVVAAEAASDTLPFAAVASAIATAEEVHA